MCTEASATARKQPEVDEAPPSPPIGKFELRLAFGAIPDEVKALLRLGYRPDVIIT